MERENRCSKVIQWAGKDCQVSGAPFSNDHQTIQAPVSDKNCTADLSSRFVCQNREKKESGCSKKSSLQGQEPLRQGAVCYPSSVPWTSLLRLGHTPSLHVHNSVGWSLFWVTALWGKGKCLSSLLHTVERQFFFSWKYLHRSRQDFCHCILHNCFIYLSLQCQILFLCELFLCTFLAH